MSGTTRSTPSISSSGNMSPQSTTTMSSSSSNTIMFLPISPNPPRGMTRRRPSLITIPADPQLEEAHLGCRIAGRLLGGRRLGLGGPPEIRQDLRQPAEIIFDQRPIALLVQRRRRVEHRDHRL